MNENDNQDEDMKDSAQLLSRFLELERRLASSSAERHRVNNSINAAITGLVDQTERQDAVLEKINENVRSMADSVDRVEKCLVGDAKFNQLGLIKEVEALKSSQTTSNAELMLRISKNEEDIKTANNEIKNHRRIVVWTGVVLAAIGGIITWIKSSGIVKFFQP